MDADKYFVRSLGCQWLGPDYDPRADRSGAPTPYCGCKDLVGSSVYCKEHYPQMYSSGTALRKRKKDLRKVKAMQDLQQMILDIAEELEDEGWEPGMDWREPESVED